MGDHSHYISIGRFAGLTGISANTLRRYDELGLLSPALTDPSSGYRLYAIEQLDATDISLSREGIAARRRPMWM
jgi:DNA-binding transcriptional MerR regulator